MALQNYTPMRLATAADPALRNELLKVDIFLRQLTPFAARVPVFPQGSTASSIDLTQFLFLPGRVPYQRSFGNVIFSTKSEDEANVLDDSIFRGFTLLGQSDTANQRTTHTVYFQPDNATLSTIVRKWIFPSISSSPTDTFTFAATTGTQTFVDKTITKSQIYVGTATARNIFINSNNVDNQFFITLPALGFPSAGTQLTPQLRIPKLDIAIPLVDRHTFMMLKASISSPFTTGSIAHGNFEGSEMEMLPAGGNGRALRFNVGETVAGCTWTNGGTTITGVFDMTKDRPGMRIRGDSGQSIYIDEATRIVTVSGTTITVDTPLVGNSVGTTVQIWGPTWDLELSGVSHGSLTGLNNDDHLQYLYLPGRAGGQVLGSGAHTGANITDLTVEGRLMLGDGLSGINYTAGRALDIRHSASNNATFVSIQNTVNTPASGAASGTLTMLLVQPNTPAYTSGSYTFRGLNFTMTGNPSPSGVTVSTLTAMFCQATPSEGGDPGAGGTFGKIDIYRGMTVDVRGTSTPASRTITTVTNGTTALTSAGLFVAPIAAGQVINKADVPARTTIASITDASNLVMSQAATGSTSSSTGILPIGIDIAGLRVSVSGRSKPVSTISGLTFADPGGGTIYATTAAIIDCAPLFDSNGVDTWSLLKLNTTIVSPKNVWLLDLTAANNSRHFGNFTIGDFVAPTAKVHIGAGTGGASAAPLKFTSGTNLVTPEAGAMEWDGSRAYLTQTVGPTRKTIAYTDDSLPSVPGFSRIFATMGA